MSKDLPRAWKIHTVFIFCNQLFWGPNEYNHSCFKQSCTGW